MRARGERICGFDIRVEPVIVVMAAELTIKAEPLDVRVVGRRRIAQWLLSRPTVLTPERVEVIYEQARREFTWRRDAAAAEGA